MPQYWRSLDELYDTPEFQDYLHREFPQAASEFPAEISRRRWLQVMGASFALAGLAGCRWQTEEIATFNSRPDGRIPGVPQKYATLFEVGGVAYPVLATCYDGRPVKADINKDHPLKLKGSTSYLQASMLNLYDPDRRGRTVEGKFDRSYNPFDETVLRHKSDGKRAELTWEDFASVWAGVKGNLAGVRVLHAASSSPTFARLKAELEAKGVGFVEHEPLKSINAQAASQAISGKSLRPMYSLASADVIVSVDDDLLGSHVNGLSHSAAWAERRAPEEGEMNRLYAVESQFSNTGAAADHRLPIRSCEIAQFVSLLHKRVSELLGGAEAVETPYGEITSESIVEAISQDLVAHQGKSLITVSADQSREVQVAIFDLNQKLGNVGHSVQYVELPAGDAGSVDGLLEEMNAGSVETLVILACNPAYDLPTSAGFADALAKVKTSIRVSEYDDETAEACDYYLPLANGYEAWGDGRSYDGTLTIRQPLIEPFHLGKSEIEILGSLLGDESTGVELVKQTVAGGLSDDQWQHIVHDGYVKQTAYAVASVGEVPADLLAQSLQTLEASRPEGDLEVVFLPGEATYDGRFANNGWLQETPGTLTKVCWDNVAILGKTTADSLNVKDEDLLELTIGGEAVQLPVYVLPGQAVGSIGVSMGYGRTLGGHIAGSQPDGVSSVGVNLYSLKAAADTTANFTVGVAAKAVGESYPLATTQNHWAIDTTGMQEIARRMVELVREGTLTEYNNHSDFAKHRTHVPPLKSLWTEREREAENQWGMSIDLTKCLGCNACMVSCQAENNVPIVGKDQVMRNREMHWIRIDRYFTAANAEQADQAAVSVQPVTCHHCENAPCEQVCPVAATVHSAEGTNDMVYNRCIGTRYCGNNCPYKVRRFNYLSNVTTNVIGWVDEDLPLVHESQYKPHEQLVQLVYNPEVSVRTRGVMEKCTYCIQRIQNGKIAAKNENRAVRDGEIVTACQEACATNAIEFGNLQDDNSRVSKAHANDRAYAMLAELNIKPRTRYLARIRNPHPLLEPGYYLKPKEGHHGGHGHEDHGHGDEAHHEADSHHEAHGDESHGDKHDEHHSKESHPEGAAG